MAYILLYSRQVSKRKENKKIKAISKYQERKGIFIIVLIGLRQDNNIILIDFF